MKISKLYLILIIFLFCNQIFSQENGLKVISPNDMKFHFDFLTSKEFNGRSAPSIALNIASKYISLNAEKIGLKPLLSNNSFFQEIQCEVTTISKKNSYLQIKSNSLDKRYVFPDNFGMNMRTAKAGKFSGDVVFLGFGFSAPNLNWDDIKDIDIKGKVVVVLDGLLPNDHILKPSENRNLILLKTRTLREKGAVAILNIINKDREKNFIERNISFDIGEKVKIIDLDLDPSQQMQNIPIIEIRHNTAAEILGISKEDIQKMYDQIIQGKQVESKILKDTKIDANIEFETNIQKTCNVIGLIEGSDPKLKNEYVVLGGHYDHLNTTEGKIFPGANDNASSSIALFEIAKALLVEKPKRSIIFIWFTAEEKGLFGSYYFLQHSPVPIEKISACLNMDMIGRNDPNGIGLVALKSLSSELDKVINEVNDKYLKMKMDYTYESPKHQERFFFRSDHYPFIRYGIPGVRFFSTPTPDYHTEFDIVDKIDFQKMIKVSKLVFLSALEIANKPELLKLDLKQEISSRGKQNFKFDWTK